MLNKLISIIYNIFPLRQMANIKKIYKGLQNEKTFVTIVEIHNLVLEKDYYYNNLYKCSKCGVTGWALQEPVEAGRFIDLFYSHVPNSQCKPD